jgi:hypothetical protein
LLRDTSTRKPLETGRSFWVWVIMVMDHSPYVAGLTQLAQLDADFSDFA